MWPNGSGTCLPSKLRRFDSRYPLCARKDCKKTYNVTYYTETKDRHNPGRAERLQRVRREAREHVFEYLSAHPCVDCGETDVVVLDFDHQGDKTEEINAMVAAGKPWIAILAEIKKCEVVCSNDHRRRTARTFGWYRLRQQSSAVSSEEEQLTLNQRVGIS
jgi:hypothetical protein